MYIDLNNLRYLGKGNLWQVLLRIFFGSYCVDIYIVSLTRFFDLVRAQIFVFATVYLVSYGNAGRVLFEVLGSRRSSD